MEPLVVDTSVIVKWYNQKEEKHASAAKQLLHDFQNNKIAIIVPDLLGTELLNVFLKGKMLEIDQVKLLLRNFYSLPLTIKETTETLLVKTAEIAQYYEITSYDALFVALAKIEECKLVSADTKAHGKIKDNTVFMLEDYSTPSLNNY